MNCYRNQQKGGLKPAHETHERRAAYHQHSEVLHCTSPFDSIPSTFTMPYLHAENLRMSSRMLTCFQVAQHAFLATERTMTDSDQPEQDCCQCSSKKARLLSQV